MEKYMKRGMDYWRIHGMQALTARVAKELFSSFLKKKNVDYQVWIQRHIPGPGELERQRNDSVSLYAEIQPDPSGEKHGGAAVKAASPAICRTRLTGIPRFVWQMRQRMFTFMRCSIPLKRRETLLPCHGTSLSIRESLRASLSLKRRRGRSALLSAGGSSDTGRALCLCESYQ